MLPSGRLACPDDPKTCTAKGAETLAFSAQVSSDSLGHLVGLRPAFQHKPTLTAKSCSKDRAASMHLSAMPLIMKA